MGEQAVEWGDGKQERAQSSGQRGDSGSVVGQSLRVKVIVINMDGSPLYTKRDKDKLVSEGYCYIQDKTHGEKVSVLTL